MRHGCYFFLCVCVLLLTVNILDEYVAGILHTIFFHRTLTLVRPKDVDCDLFEITYVSITCPGKETMWLLLSYYWMSYNIVLFPPYIWCYLVPVYMLVCWYLLPAPTKMFFVCVCGQVQCGLAELEKEVDEKINQFIAWAEKHPNRRSQVVRYGKQQVVQFAHLCDFHFNTW